MKSTLRPILLSLLLLSLVAAGLPVSDSLAAHWTGQPHAHRKHGKKHYRRRHSRAWWRRRRAMLRRRRALALQRRAASSPAVAGNDVSGVAVKRRGDSERRARLAVSANAAAPRESRPTFDLTMPASWSSTGGSASSGEMKFTVRTLDGQAAGAAALAPAVVTSSPDTISTSRTKTLGNVPLTAWRRTVIDRMVAEGGWVVNDALREMNGRQVYVVTAQTSTANGTRQARTFYFTEVEGRVYALSTTAPVELAAPVAASSEQVVATFRPAGSNAAVLASKSPANASPK